MSDPGGSGEHKWVPDDDLVVCWRYVQHRNEPRPTADTSWCRIDAARIGTTSGSVAARYLNFQWCATGQGLANAAPLTQQTWDEWGHRPDELAVAARAAERRLDDARRAEREPLPEITAEAQARIDARMAERRQQRRR